MTYTKTLKPDQRAYQQCIDELDLPASACVVVDDHYRNIEGADTVNMRDMHFDVLDPKTSYSNALELHGLDLVSIQSSWGYHHVVDLLPNLAATSGTNE